MIPLGILGAGVVAGTAPVGVTLTYTSPGDTGGLFYYRGTDGLVNPWTNPSDSGAVAASASSSYGVEYLPPRTTDRGGSNYPWHSGSAVGNWIKFDLIDYSLEVTDYTMKARADYPFGTSFTQWVLEGSNDDSTWFELDARTDTPAFDTWAHYTAAAGGESYRYLRITDTSGASYIIIGEIEFYGELIEP